MTWRVIGFAGVMGSGKDTAADIAQAELNKTNMLPWRDAFANEVKSIAITDFGWDGHKDALGRKLLQLIGTEVGRTYNENIWVERLENKLHDIHAENLVAVISDVRFPNEIEWCNKHGMTILLTGRSAVNEGIQGHASEQVPTTGYTESICNDGSLEDLRQAVYDILKSHNYIK